VALSVWHFSEINHVGKPVLITPKTGHKQMLLDR
jgi:hypothetical protein